MAKDSGPEGLQEFKVSFNPKDARAMEMLGSSLSKLEGIVKTLSETGVALTSATKQSADKIEKSFYIPTSSAKAVSKGFLSAQASLTSTARGNDDEAPPLFNLASAGEVAMQKFKKELLGNRRVIAQYQAMVKAYGGSMTALPEDGMYAFTMPKIYTQASTGRSVTAKSLLSTKITNTNRKILKEEALENAAAERSKREAEAVKAAEAEEAFIAQEDRKARKEEAKREAEDARSAERKDRLVYRETERERKRMMRRVMTGWRPDEDDGKGNKLFEKYVLDSADRGSASEMKYAKSLLEGIDPEKVKAAKETQKISDSIEKQHADAQAKEQKRMMKQIMTGWKPAEDDEKGKRLYSRALENAASNGSISEMRFAKNALNPDANPEKGPSGAFNSFKMLTQVTAAVLLLKKIVDLIGTFFSSVAGAAGDARDTRDSARRLGIGATTLYQYQKGEQAKGLAEGTIAGAIQSVQKDFGDITNTPSKVISLLGMSGMAGNTISKLIQMNETGNMDPEEATDTIIKHMVQQITSGFDIKGQKVGTSRAKQSWISGMQFWGIDPSMQDVVISRSMDATSDALTKEQKEAARTGTMMSWLYAGNTHLQAAQTLTPGDFARSEQFDRLLDEFGTLISVFKDGILVRLSPVFDDLVRMLRSQFIYKLGNPVAQQKYRNEARAASAETLDSIDSFMSASNSFLETGKKDFFSDKENFKGAAPSKKTIDTILEGDISNIPTNLTPKGMKALVNLLALREAQKEAEIEARKQQENIASEKPELDAVMSPILASDTFLSRGYSNIQKKTGKNAGLLRMIVGSLAATMGGGNFSLAQQGVEANNASQEFHEATKYAYYGSGKDKIDVAADMYKDTAMTQAQMAVELAGRSMYLDLMKGDGYKSTVYRVMSGNSEVSVVLIDEKTGKEVGSTRTTIPVTIGVDGYSNTVNTQNQSHTSASSVFSMPESAKGFGFK